MYKGPKILFYPITTTRGIASLEAEVDLYDLQVIVEEGYPNMLDSLTAKERSAFDGENIIEIYEIIRDRGILSNLVERNKRSFNVYGFCIAKAETIEDFIEYLIIIRFHMAPNVFGIYPKLSKPVIEYCMN